VSFADDPGWAAELQAWRTAPPGEVPAALLAGAVAALARWSSTWPARPVCVVPLPTPAASHTSVDAHCSASQTLAAHIAQKGRLPLCDVLSWTGGPVPNDVASASVVTHLESAIRLTANAINDANHLKGPVLLVASHVRTRWAATLAAALLRENGASQVLLLALHLQP
jgi:ATP-dependent DNA helicase RecQ